MNTGSGKMAVGLLILQSSLNENAGPAVYVAPDKYLSKQVLSEAEDLGLAATDDPTNGSFLSGDAILVINVHRLFNGKSVFGVGSQGVRIPIGAIVIDDAHACLESVSDQFRIALSESSAAYGEILKTFEDDLRSQSVLGLIEVQRKDNGALISVPFWAWQDKVEQVTKILHARRADNELEFAWPLLKEVLSLCQCAFGGGRLEIAPRCLPIDEVSSFEKAQRRIYMTATLADDGLLVTHLDANHDSVVDPIKPRGAGEIGDRMIIVPEELNDELTDAEIKALVLDVAKTHNVVIIVPSRKRAGVWGNLAAQTLDKENIWEGVERLKAGHVGVTVMVNRYDGVDLPEDACRLLIIDGVPEVAGLLERVEAAVLEDTELQMIRHIQRLEQGMGRGVRSGKDRCAVFLLGPRLAQRVSQPDARNMFTAATLTQLEMGKELTRQIKGKPIAELRPLLDLCIELNNEQGVKWRKAGRVRLAKAPEGKSSHVDQSISLIRSAFKHARVRQYKKAASLLQEAVNHERDRTVRGYLKQQLAEYTHYFNPVEAQEIMLSAVSDNRKVAKPLQGITYSKLLAPAAGQAAAALSFIQSRSIDLNYFVIFVNALAKDLRWDKDQTTKFEASMRDLGLVLGFGSQQPDNEFRGGGPDNIWALGNLKFVVIECKSGVDNDGRLISKDDCSQLLSSYSWFETRYDGSCIAVPVLVHPSREFEREASPATNFRIIDTNCLDKLKVGLMAYAKAVAMNGLATSIGFIEQQLNHYSFTSAKFIETYTVPYRTRR